MSHFHRQQHLRAEHTMQPSEQPPATPQACTQREPYVDRMAKIVVGHAINPSDFPGKSDEELRWLNGAGWPVIVRVASELSGQEQKKLPTCPYPEVSAVRGESAHCCYAILSSSDLERFDATNDPVSVADRVSSSTDLLSGENLPYVHAIHRLFIQKGQDAARAKARAVCASCRLAQCLDLAAQRYKESKEPGDAAKKAADTYITNIFRT